MYLACRFYVHSNFHFSTKVFMNQGSLSSSLILRKYVIWNSSPACYRLVRVPSSLLCEFWTRNTTLRDQRFFQKKIIFEFLILSAVVIIHNLNSTNLKHKILCKTVGKILIITEDVILKTRKSKRTDQRTKLKTINHENLQLMELNQTTFPRCWRYKERQHSTIMFSCRSMETVNLL